MLTWCPAVSSASADRSRVSSVSRAAISSPATCSTVIRTPLTHSEPPGSSRVALRGARTTTLPPLAFSISPISVMRPVNIASPSCSTATVASAEP